MGGVGVSPTRILLTGKSVGKMPTRQKQASIAYFFLTGIRIAIVFSFVA